VDSLIRGAGQPNTALIFELLIDTTSLGPLLPGVAPVPRLTVIREHETS
jgi:hypothetical protein